MVAGSRRGASGGAVAMGALPQTGPVLTPITLTQKVASFAGEANETLYKITNKGNYYMLYAGFHRNKIVNLRMLLAYGYG
jgi:hypothetical protein